MRVLGIDLGTKRVGVAVGDTDIGVATPTEVLRRDRGRALVDQLATLIDEWEPELLVVGLPRSLDGSDGPAAQRARSEAGRLASELHIPVELHDERLTTVSAQAALHAAGVDTKKGRGVVDSVAASVILQNWFDARDGAGS